MEPVRSPGRPLPRLGPQRDAERARERAGVGFALACAINGAFVPAVAKITTAAGDGLSVALLTTAIGACVAAVVLIARGQWRALTAPGQWPALAALGILGTGVSFALFFSGASRASATETVLCLQIEPVYSLFLAWLVLGHRPTPHRIAATAVILLGLVLALGIRDLPASQGVWYLLATPLCWQLSHLIVLRSLVGVPLPVLTAGRYVWGAVALMVFWLLAPSSKALPAAAAWPWLLVQGAVLSYGGTTLWYAAVRRIDLARATVLVVPTVPVLALGVSYLLLAETPQPLEWIGLALTVLGVYVFASRPATSAVTAPVPRVR